MPAFAQEGDDPRTGYVHDHFAYVPLQLRGGAPATVRQVFLNVGGQVQIADPEAGVERVDQNRLDWSGIPLIGKLAHGRYNEADFTADREIGDAYFADGTIWLDLSGEPTGHTYRELVFLNQTYAYQLADRPLPAKSASLPGQPPGRIIGQVYRGGDGSLLVLVKPFVVTDSLF